MPPTQLQMRQPWEGLSWSSWEIGNYKTCIYLVQRRRFNQDYIWRMKKNHYHFTSSFWTTTWCLTLYNEFAYTIGNVKGGGIHHGLRRSAMAFFSPFTLGRLASKGEKTRLFIDTTRKNSVTIPLASVSGVRPAGRGTDPAMKNWLTCCRLHSAPVIKATWLGIATAYLVYPMCTTWHTIQRQCRFRQKCVRRHEFVIISSKSSLYVLIFSRVIPTGTYRIPYTGNVMHVILHLRDQISLLEQRRRSLLWLYAWPSETHSDI